MVAITRNFAPFPDVTGPARRSSPELDAKARTCRAQLADWVTCPSANTPEGKAKIEKITAKLDSIKHEINTSDSPPPSEPGSRRDTPGRIAASADELADYGSAPGRVGGNVDTFA